MIGRLRTIGQIRICALVGVIIAAQILCWRCAAPAWAQQPARSAEPASPTAMGVPQAVVEATEVLRVADEVARALATTRRIAHGAAVRLGDGRVSLLSAAQVFVLLARFLGTGYEDGVTPEYVPAPPVMAGPLETGQAAASAAQELVLNCADLLAQARPTADVAESTGRVPEAVWVEGVRLTPAQFLGAMATLLQHALHTGEAPEQVAVGQYLPPLDWAALPAQGAAATPAGTVENLLPEPESVAEAESAAPPPPQLVLYLPAQEPLSGIQSLTVQYRGPAAFIRISIDGRAKAVSNMPHFVYLWDTRLEPDGDHLIHVTAVTQSEETLDSVEATVETANGNLPLR